MTDDFAWHAAVLKGERGPISADDPQSGFYRQKRRDGTYEPVAYWKDSQTGEQRCHINGKSPNDPLRMFEAWPYASKNPITAEAYWHRMDTGAWMDNDASAAATANGPEIDPATDPASSLKAEIDAAKAGLAAYATIDSDEAAARAQTLRSALTGLSGKATKAYEALNRPLLDEQTRIRKVWFPLRDDATAGADDIRKALGTWNDIKLAAQKAADEANRKAAAEAAEKLAAEQEAHRKAVAAAEKANEPPPPPPEPVKIEPIRPNAPAPSTIIRGGSGRAASVTVANIITNVDLDKCFAKFRDAPELRELFMSLADKSMKAGICTAEDIGAIIEQKSVIR